MPIKNNILEQTLESRISVLEQALSRLGQGILLLSKLGEVQFTTQVAQQMIEQNDGLSLHQGKLVAHLNQDNIRLQSMLVNIMQEDASDKNYQNFYIHRKENLRPYLLFISRIHIDNDKSPLNNEESILIVIRDLQANTSYWVQRLKTHFNLTNREADFTVLLTEGRSISEISEVMNIAEETTRQYLKNCFKKMEVQKQHELVCLALDYSRKR